MAHFPLLFGNYGKWLRADIYKCQYIVKSLMIWEEHKAVFFWDILKPMGIYGHISTFISAVCDEPEHPVMFFFCVFVYVGCMIT